jgi:hypothetical protein
VAYHATRCEETPIVYRRRRNGQPTNAAKTGQIGRRLAGDGFGDVAARLLTRIDDLNATTAAVEMDETVDQGVEREVAPLANPIAGVKFVAHLADDNVPGSHGLSAE